MLAQYMHEKHGLDLAQVKYSLIHASGGVSGGTIQSFIEAMTNKDLKGKDQMNPYLLATRNGIDKLSFPTLVRDHDFSPTKWQAFFVMSVVNEKIVRRSWSIYTDRGQSYGKLFSYKESMTLSFVPALFLTTLLYTVLPLTAILFKFGPIRETIRKWLPGSGDGPDAEKRKKGNFEIQLVGTADTEPYDEPVRVRGIIKGFRDPGYGDTCRMVVESALSIVKNLKDLPGKEGGILTPATAFGNVLLERLRHNNGMIFEVEDIKK
jgi:short subunit dehydrogenase-like uncharacterized protein